MRLNTLNPMFGRADTYSVPLGLNRLAQAISETGAQPPFYAYDTDSCSEALTDLLSLLEATFSDFETRIYLPVFANPCFPWLDSLASVSERVGLLVNSIPELLAVRAYRWHRMPGIAFAGGVLSKEAVEKVCKTADQFYATSLENLRFAGSLNGRQASLGLRLDLSGTGECRGLSSERLIRLLNSEPDLAGKVESIHAYQGPTAASFASCLAHGRMLLELAHGFPSLREVNFSGGWPFDYSEIDSPLPSSRTEFMSSLKTLSSECAATIGNSGVKNLVWEPGKFLLAAHGYYFCRVIEVDETAPGHFDVHLESSFTHLPALKLKGRQHGLNLLDSALRVKRDENVFCRLRGMTGLSTDFLMPGQVLMPRPASGDIVAIHDVGVYGWAGSYNFLGLQRPAEYALSKGKLRLLRRQQDAQHLLEGLEGSPRRELRRGSPLILRTN
jgi:diaminopimelate decarboxylase